jgi:hypothetical protein
MFNLATEELVAPGHSLDWCKEQQQAAEVRAAEAAEGKSKAKARKAADRVELWREEAIVTEGYRVYCDLLRERGLVDFSFLRCDVLSCVLNSPTLRNSPKPRFVLHCGHRQATASQGDTMSDVDLNAQGDISVGGDVTGRDKVTAEPGGAAAGEGGIASTGVDCKRCRGAQPTCTYVLALQSPNFFHISN